LAGRVEPLGTVTLLVLAAEDGARLGGDESPAAPTVVVGSHKIHVFIANIPTFYLKYRI
jgi:hypothetical protein